VGKIKKHVREFMDKAVKKKEERRRQKAAQKAENKDNLTPSETKGDTPATPQGDVEWTDDMLNAASPAGSSLELKRKREEEGGYTSPKRTRTDEEIAPTPPPPPPVSNAYEETATTPMDDSFAMTFPEVMESRGKAGVHLDGYGSPMQLATPSTNGSSGTRPVNGGNRR
jgi:hypothetical protein